MATRQQEFVDLSDGRYAAATILVDVDGNPVIPTNAYSKFSAFLANNPVPAGRAIQIVCTVAGNVELQMAGGGLCTVPVPTGLTVLPYAVTEVLSTLTTATATYGNLS